LYRYQLPLSLEKKPRFGRLDRAVTACDSQAKADSVKAGQYRSKRNLRRLVQSNSYKWYEQGRVYNPMFLTLTFRGDMTDVSVANKAFMRFVQRINYKIFKPLNQSMAYVAVIEFQKDVDFQGNLKEKGGNVHYHMIIFNLPFIADHVYQTLLKIWRKNNGEGSIFLEKIKSLDGAVKYITKYLTKCMSDARLFNKKRFFASRNLLKPVVLRDDYTCLALIDLVIHNLKFCFNCGSFPLTGEIKYYRFDLPDYIGFVV